MIARPKPETYPSIRREWRDAGFPYEHEKTPENAELVEKIFSLPTLARLHPTPECIAVFSTGHCFNCDGECEGHLKFPISTRSTRQSPELLNSENDEGDGL